MTMHTKGPPLYGCHCDLEPGQKPDGCVFDTGDIADCVSAGRLEQQGKGKTDCEYWQPIHENEAKDMHAIKAEEGYTLATEQAWKAVTRWAPERKER